MIHLFNEHKPDSRHQFPGHWSWLKVRKYRFTLTEFETDTIKPGVETESYTTGLKEQQH